MNIYEHDVERLLYLNTIRDRVAVVFGLIAICVPALIDTVWIEFVVFIVLALLLFLLYKLLLKYLMKDVEAVIAALRCDIDALEENIEYYEAERIFELTLRLNPNHIRAQKALKHLREK